MSPFIIYLLQCIIFVWIFFSTKKTYSLLLAIFYILNFTHMFILDNLSIIAKNVLFIIEVPLFIAGVILFYKDYKKNKK